MRDVYANEVRHLKPWIRRKMLTGEVSYRDQERPISLENEHDQRLQAAGLRQGFGGHRHMPADARVDVLARDNMSRMPYFNRTRSNVEVDNLDEG